MSHENYLKVPPKYAKRWINYLLSKIDAYDRYWFKLMFAQAPKFSWSICNLTKAITVITLSSSLEKDNVLCPIWFWRSTSIFGINHHRIPNRLQNSVFRLARCFLSLVVVSSTGNVKKFKTRAAFRFDISQNTEPNKIIFRKAAQSYSLPKKMLRTRYEVATKSPCWFVREGVRARPLDTLNSGSGGPGFKPPPRRSP